MQVQQREAFGKLLAAQSSMEQHVAQSRAALEQSRLLVLKTAHMMDTVGNRVRSLHFIDTVGFGIKTVVTSLAHI